MWQTHISRWTVLGDSRTPPKVLPLDGDYPGGYTGIPLDGYWTMETSHGVTPYFSDAGTDFIDAGVSPQVVTSPNVLDFGYNPAGAIRPRSAQMLKALGLGKRTNRVQLKSVDRQQLASAGESPVATRPDAACYFCLKTTNEEWQRYRACSQVCLKASCIARCEDELAANNFGVTTPVFVTEACVQQCS